MIIHPTDSDKQITDRAADEAFKVVAHAFANGGSKGAKENVTQLFYDVWCACRQRTCNELANGLYNFADKVREDR